MISQETKTIIEKTAKEFLEKRGAGARIHNVSADDSTVSVEITMEDAQVVIGDRGRTLLDIQHVLQAMARKKIEERFEIALDINEYKKRKEEYLRDLANDFHTYYNAHQFIVDDEKIRNARLALIKSAKQVLQNGLGLLGVSAPDKM